MKDLRDKIFEIMNDLCQKAFSGGYDLEQLPIDFTDQILTLLEKCPAMTIEQCPWGKENVEFREIFLRGINRQLDIGSALMASQIRKAIEQGIGRFSNEDANWILDYCTCNQIRREVGN